MRFGLLVILTLAVGSVAAHFLLQDNGYVLINFRGYAIEMSVPVLAFVLVLFYLALRLLVRIWRAPRALGEAAGRARERRSGKKATAGMIALSQGRLAKGERLLTRAAAESPAPLLNYLAAARAAQMQGDRERRDSWLRMAYEVDEAAVNAVLLTQAELQLADGDSEQALASLSRLLESEPKHPQALRLLAELRHAEQNWLALADLLPRLRKLANVSAKQLELWNIDTYAGLLNGADIDRAAIDTYWQAMPRAMRKKRSLVRARVRALVRVNAIDEAEKEIRRGLGNDWDEELVALYGELELGDSARQLSTLEGWLRQRPEEPTLLLAAGRACINNKLWGKARSYLESSLAAKPTPMAYNVLGQLMLQLGDNNAATDAFRKGLTLGYAGSPDIPQLTADPKS
jgi:HemY protein